MKILALDTTAKSASAAITDGREPLAVFTLEAGLTHSETVLPMIKTALESLHMSAHDIDLFAVTAGPGSFTGVRIGISEIKGLAFATGKPCVGVSTLLSLTISARYAKMQFYVLSWTRAEISCTMRSSVLRAAFSPAFARTDSFRSPT